MKASSDGSHLRDRLMVVASPTFAPPTDGSAVPAVVRGASRRGEAWNMTTSTGKSTIAIDPVLSLSSLIIVRDAVRMGVGVARLPVSLVSHDLADGTLVRWGDVEGPEIALWALYP